MNEALFDMSSDVATDLAEPGSDGVIASFFVAGKPMPGGSKRGIKHSITGKTVMIDMSKNAGWKSLVAYYARQNYQHDPADGPLAFRFEFFVSRPKYHYGTGRNAGRLKESAPPYPTTMPDSTKLTRSTEDALTGILWQDDSQVVHQVVSKVYGPTPGVRITLRRM